MKWYFLRLMLINNFNNLYLPWTAHLFWSIYLLFLMSKYLVFYLIVCSLLYRFCSKCRLKQVMQLFNILSAKLKKNSLYVYTSIYQHFQIEFQHFSRALKHSVYFLLKIGQSSSWHKPPLTGKALIRDLKRNLTASISISPYEILSVTYDAISTIAAAGHLLSSWMAFFFIWNRDAFGFCLTFFYQKSIYDQNFHVQGKTVLILSIYCIYYYCSMQTKQIYVELNLSWPK